ncbi:MAG: M20 family metallopeptidase [Haloarculaceae archaeon]
MSFDRLDFHERAVRTPSHESVDEMRALLVDTLRAAGADPTVDGRGNTLATRTADGHDDPEVLQGDAAAVDGRHLVLNTHIDTVPPHVPFAEREGGAVVEGRGACDAKGPLAALVDAFLRADVETGRLTLAVTPDEEVSQTGAAHLAGTLAADGFVVGEPTDLDVCTAARGQFEGAVTVQGTSAHAATPEEGDNAVRALAPLLQAMETYDQERETRSVSDGASGDHRAPRARGPGKHESLGRPTLTPTLVSGGAVPNQVPAEATVTFDRRSVPPESAPEFRAALEDHLSAWVPESMGLRVDLEERETPYLEAFATDEDEPLVRTLARASGGAVRPFGAATEASFFAARAPTVVFGPGVLADEQGAVAHSDREYVRRADVELAADAVRETVDELL